MLKIKAGERITIPGIGSWPEAVHIFDDESIWAINAALTAERPLLIKGEPGAGKSQLARAAAYGLGRLFVSEVVHARSESQDLQYDFDTVGRLGKAQVLSVSHSDCRAEELLAPKYFISPGPLWWVFDWDSAEKQFEISTKSTRKPEKPHEHWTVSKGSVLLIDEIDKAEADLPNGLLETLGNGAFTVPYLDRPVGLSSKCAVPLVVVTTNGERELPLAFTRRCLVLKMKFGDKEGKLSDIDWLIERGHAHFGERCDKSVLDEAAVQLCSDRAESLELGLPPPGLAEYLDMIRTISRMAQTKSEQKKVLTKIKNFSLSKHRESSH